MARSLDDLAYQIALSEGFYLAYIVGTPGSEASGLAAKIVQEVTTLRAVPVDYLIIDPIVAHVGIGPVSETMARPQRVVEIQEVEVQFGLGTRTRSMFPDLIPSMPTRSSQDAKVDADGLARVLRRLTQGQFKEVLLRLRVPEYHLTDSPSTALRADRLVEWIREERGPQGLSQLEAVLGRMSADFVTRM